MKIERNVVKYKNAENCKKCPGKSGPDGCPWWWTFKKKNSATGEEAMDEECGKSALPFFLDHVCMNSAQPAAEMSKMRSEVVGAVHNGFRSLVDNFKPSEPVEAIEHKEDKSNGR